MVKVDVKHDLDRLVSKLDDVQRNQLPFAISKAVNETAKIVKTREQEEMPRVFDRPTPYTLNSLFMKPGTKRFPIATVWLKDDAGKGTPAAKYLLPQIEGGGRRYKRFERALAARGLLPAGMYVVPGSAAKLDAYGNMSRGQIVQILSALGAAETVSGFMANRTERSKKRKGKRLTEYFVGQPGNGRLPMGIWQRITFGFGSAVKPVAIFTDRPNYRQRFRFVQIAQRTVKEVFPDEFSKAYQYAIATAR